MCTCMCEENGGSVEEEEELPFLNSKEIHAWLFYFNSIELVRVKTLLEFEHINCLNISVYIYDV